MYHIETWVNRKALDIKTDADMFQKKISNNLALEKGVETFYEMILYGVIFGITIYELWYYTAESAEHKSQESKRFAKITNDVRVFVDSKKDRRG